MPPGWVRADDRTAARAFPGRVGGAREAHFSAWVPADGTAPGPVIVLQAISQPGIGDSVDLDPDTFFGEIKEGFEEQVGRERAGAAYRRGTDLGGRPAGLLVGWGPGEEAVAVQMLAAARGDAAYTVTAFGPAAVNPRLEAALAALRASWSWR